MEEWGGGELPHERGFYDNLIDRLPANGITHL